jgi:ABC-type branched-subunit amino acid transport system ATPase component
MRLLEVVGLAKRFGPREALAGVSFTVEEGHVVALVGPAGSGKTTCLDCIAGALVPDGGRIVFDGRDITREPVGRPDRRGILRSPPGPSSAPGARLLLLDDGADAAVTVPALRARGVTVILTARHLGPLRDLVDSMIVLDHGRAVAADR